MKRGGGNSLAAVSFQCIGITRLLPMMETDMRKDRSEEPTDPGYGVGLPISVIAFYMLTITAYLLILDIQIPPPQTGVYLATDR